MSARLAAALDAAKVSDIQVVRVSMVVVESLRVTLSSAVVIRLSVR